MKLPCKNRTRPAGLAVAVGVGAALCASNGPAVGVTIGLALAVTLVPRWSRH